MSPLDQASTTPVATRPALRYFGGKWRLASWILAHLPPHRCYVEPFGGAASVLLRKEPAEVEIYNDTADAVVNFFRVLRDQPADLVAALQLTPFALVEYSTCREQDGSPVERARRFFVRSWGGHHGVSGNGRNRGWRRTHERGMARSFASAVDALATTAHRLRGVAIESLDWREALTRYDAPDACHYVDPPYVLATRKSAAPSDGYGEHELTDADHVELLETLQRLKGSVVLSGYRCALYDEALRGWRRVDRDAERQGARLEVLWVRNRTTGGAQ